MILYADMPGERLDAFLARCGEGLTRSAAQKLIEQGLVKRNGKPGKKNDKLNAGDRVEYVSLRRSLWTSCQRKWTSGSSMRTRICW